ncbi:MAG: AAA family ATPase [Cyanobacteria bacterium P01_E01_bin.42]
MNYTLLPFLIPPDNLEQEQANAFLILRDALRHKVRECRLIGAAGTGKTHTMGQFLHALIDNEILLASEIIVSAYSHKACGVIRSVLRRDNDLNIEVKTLASLLGLKPNRDKKTGRETFEPDESKLLNLDIYKIIIVDECSAVGENLDKWLQSAIQQSLWKPQLIWMGDGYQLPPVGETISPSLEREMSSAELVTPVRYGGSIGKLCNEIRKAIDEGRTIAEIESDWEDTTTGIFTGDKSWWKDNIVQAFSSPLAADSDYIRTICYTNSAVDSINKMVRDRLIGEDAQEIVLGERLIANEACNEGDDLLLPSSMEFIVEDIFKKEINITINDSPLRKINQFIERVDERTNLKALKGLKIENAIEQMKKCKVWSVFTTRSDDGTKIFLRKVAAESADTYSRLKKMFADNKVWGSFYDMRDFSHNIKPCYALTAHKSQGSTFQNVAINLPDMRRNKNKKEQTKLLYVAVSRAKKRVLIPEV